MGQASSRRPRTWHQRLRMRGDRGSLSSIAVLGNVCGFSTFAEGVLAMTDENKRVELKQLAKVVVEQTLPSERAQLRDWVAKLIAIREAGGETFSMAKRAVTVTLSDGVAMSIVRALAMELKRLAWTERGLKWRVGFVTAVVGAVVTGGQGAGIAALGGAIGVPLWLVIGAGGSFLTMLWEELDGSSKPHARQPPGSNPPPPDRDADERREGSTPRWPGGPLVIDVEAKDVGRGLQRLDRPESFLQEASVSAPAEKPEATAQRRLWVGDLDGARLLYDPDLQIDGSPHVFLWDERSREVVKYVPHVLRKAIRTYRGPLPDGPLQREYLAWFETHGPAWRASELPYYLQQAEAVARHREKLSELGVPYGGVLGQDAQRTAVTRRVTHCYSCSQKLDGGIRLACSHCNWILCSCGACGCGYRG